MVFLKWLSIYFLIFSHDNRWVSHEKIKIKFNSNEFLHMLKPLTMSLIALTLQGEDIMLCIIIEYSSFKEFWVLETRWDYSNWFQKDSDSPLDILLCLPPPKLYTQPPSSFVINP
jgi:hypothetical protein